MSNTILIVEDDPLLRMSACDLLEMSGATATAVGTADQAIAYLEADAASIGAMVTDVIMPGAMDGVGLAREVRRRWPHIRVLVTSGTNASQRDDFPAGVSFVQKPWSARDILGIAP